MDVINNAATLTNFIVNRMTRSLLFLLILFSLVTNDLDGQSEQKKIRLKDGSTLVGEVIEDTDYWIKMVIETGDTLTIGYKYIAQTKSKRSSRSLKPFTFKDGDYLFNIGMRYLFESENTYEITMSAMRRFSNRLYAGISTSHLRREDIINDNYIDPNFLNLGASLRYDLFQKKQRIFLEGEFGYSWVTNQQFGFGPEPSFIDGGWQGSLYTGIHFPSRQKIWWLLYGGIRMSKTSGQLKGFSHFNGENLTIYTKDYFSPFIGFKVEF